MFYFHSFTQSCPVFPAPLIEETVFSLLYILAPFLINELAINFTKENPFFFCLPFGTANVKFPPAQSNLTITVEVKPI